MKNVVFYGEMTEFWCLGSFPPWVMESESSLCWISERGGVYLKATRCGILTHRSLWSDFVIKLKGGYLPWAILISCDPHIPYIACLFLFSLLVAGPIDPCMSFISSQSPSLAVKELVFFLEFIRWCPPLILFGLLFFPVFNVLCYIW